MFSRLNMSHWYLKTKWPVDRKSELFHKRKITKTNNNKKNCWKKKTIIRSLCSLLKCALSFSLYTTCTLFSLHPSPPQHSLHKLFPAPPSPMHVLYVRIFPGSLASTMAQTAFITKSVSLLVGGVCIYLSIALLFWGAHHQTCYF